MHTSPPTSADDDFVVAKNTSFSDARQFGDEDDTTWDFSNKMFRMGLKGNFEQDVETVAFTSADSEIVIADAVLRILVFNVTHTKLQEFLVPGTYLYDLMMLDIVTGIRMQLLHGKFIYADAVTEG